MTSEEARSLVPGDRIRLRPQPTSATNPPTRAIFTVAKVEHRGGQEVRIVSVEGFRFTPWEVERYERERRP